MIEWQEPRAGISKSKLVFWGQARKLAVSSSTLCSMGGTMSALPQNFGFETGAIVGEEVS